MINKNKYTRTTTGVLKALHNTQLYIFQDAKQPQLFSFHNMDSCNPVFKNMECASSNWRKSLKMDASYWKNGQNTKTSVG